jgi:hypothetical protein
VAKKGEKKVSGIGKAKARLAEASGAALSRQRCPSKGASDIKIYIHNHLASTRKPARTVVRRRSSSARKATTQKSTEKKFPFEKKKKLQVMRVRKCENR